MDWHCIDDPDELEEKVIKYDIELRETTDYYVSIKQQYQY